MKRLVLIFVLCVMAVTELHADVSFGMAYVDSQIAETKIRQGRRGKLAYDIVVFEVNGKKYFIDDLSRLLSDKNKNICIYNGSEGKIETLYSKLLSVCETEIDHELDADLSAKITRWSYRLRATTEEKLRICLLERERLRKATKAKSTVSTVFLNSDLDKCISQVGVQQNKDVCPAKWSVRDPKYLSNFTDLNRQYTQRHYSFKRKYTQSGLVGVFNGYALIVCDGSKPVYIVQPSFSGLERCQGSNFEEYPNFGSVPTGVYMVRKTDAEIMDGDKVRLSWGKYRTPLVPATSTQTFGRGGFYLHGTTDPDKRRSGGCISLGTGIEEFMDNFFLKQNGDMLVIVDMVNTVAQSWNK